MSVLVSFLCMFICMLYLFLVNVRSRKLILLLSSFVMLMLVSNCSSCIFCVLIRMTMSSTYLL